MLTCLPTGFKLPSFCYICFLLQLKMACVDHDYDTILLPMKGASSLGVFGPPYSGKSYLVRKILENADKMYEKKVSHVLYCYGIYLQEFESMKKTINNLTIHEGLPDENLVSRMSKNGDHFIIVLDDLQESLNRSKEAALLFTKGCHHNGFSLIYMGHNLYGAGQFSRLISLNVHYMIIFRSNRDRAQIAHLARQLMGGKGQGKSDYFMKAYELAISEPHGFLFVDNHPSTVDEKYRLRSHILPESQPTIIYTPKLV